MRKTPRNSLKEQFGLEGVVRGMKYWRMLGTPLRVDLLTKYHVAKDLSKSNWRSLPMIVKAFVIHEALSPVVEAAKSQADAPAPVFTPEPPAPEFISFKAEVIADQSGEWVANALRFATEEEAKNYAADLHCRWTAVKESRAVPSTDPVNYSFIDWNLVRLEKKND